VAGEGRIDLPEVRGILIERISFLVVLSGPSGAGKSTIARGLLERSGDLELSVSMTTRPARRGEKDGEEYSFVSLERFHAAREGGELLEWAEVHGNLYGTPAAFVERTLSRGQNVLLEIDVQGGMSVKKRIPEAVLIFLLPPSFPELERRLRGRATDDEEAIRQRLENAKKELELYVHYDYLVVNEDVERCTNEVFGIVTSESRRRSRTTIDLGE
jgi:guanylate kinase